jgi:hypothetical protein
MVTDKELVEKLRSGKWEFKGFLVLGKSIKDGVVLVAFNDEKGEPRVEPLEFTD